MPHIGNQSHRGEVITFTSDGESLSYHYDELWDFTGMESLGVGIKATVSFIKTNPAYKHVIQDTLYDLYTFYKHRDYQAPTSNQLSSWKRGLQSIAETSKSSEWAQLNDIHVYRTFKKRLKGRRLGVNAIVQHVVVLNKLFDMGVIHRVINGKELVALAKEGKRQQHIAVPIGMYQQLLTHFIKTIETYHPIRHEIARAVLETYNIQERVRSGENVLLGKKGSNGVGYKFSDNKGAENNRVSRACRLLIKHNIPGFKNDMKGEKIHELQLTGLIVVLVFSGVRLGEANSFNQASYGLKTVGKGKEISVLQGETTKGNDGTPKRVTWQSHSIAKDALELVQCITEPIRDLYKNKIQSLLESGQYNKDKYHKAMKEVNSAFIPCSPSQQKNTYVLSASAEKINNLMKSLGIRATAEDVEQFNLLNPSREGQLKVGGQLPKLTAHDFRRSFAVFFKRYGFGTASGIKFQYKHDNINMSEYYCNNADLMRMHEILMDNELLQIMEEEGIHLGVDVYDEIYNQSEHLSGVEGDRIAADKFEKVKSGQHVYMNRSEIERLVKNGDIAVVQLPTGGYCTNPDCERVCGMGLFIAEKSKCPHTVHTDKTAKKMAKFRKRLINQFRGFNTGDSLKNSILVGLKQKIKDIEVTLDTHEINHEKFNDTVKGLSNG